LGATYHKKKLYEKPTFLKGACHGLTPS